MKSGNVFYSKFTGGIDLGDFKDFAFLLLSSAYVVLCRVRQKEVPFFCKRMDMGS